MRYDTLQMLIDQISYVLNASSVIHCHKYAACMAFSSFDPEAANKYGLTLFAHIVSL